MAVVPSLNICVVVYTLLLLSGRLFLVQTTIAAGEPADEQLRVTAELESNANSSELIRGRTVR